MPQENPTVLQYPEQNKRTVAGPFLVLFFIAWPMLTIFTPAGYVFLKAQWLWYGLWLGSGAAGIAFIIRTVNSKSKRIAIILTCMLVGPVELFLVWSQFLERPRVESSEAKVVLGGIYTATTANKERRKTYELTDIRQLGYELYSVRPYLYSFWYAVNGVPTRVPLPVGASYKPGPCDVLTPPTSVKVTASATGFTAAAKGNRTHLFECDEWSINEKRELIHTLDDAKK